MRLRLRRQLDSSGPQGELDDRAVSVFDRVEAAVFAHFAHGLLLALLIVTVRLLGILDDESAVLAWAAWSMLNVAALTVRGADLGKLLAGLRCLRLSGEPLGFLRSILRSVHLLAPLACAVVIALSGTERWSDLPTIAFVSISALSLVTLVKTKGRKSVGDLLAGSECVRVPEESSD